MKRRSKFIIGLASAVITFGTLTATLGPQRMHHMHRHHCNTYDNCSHTDGENSAKAPPSSVQ